MKKTITLFFGRNQKVSLLLTMLMLLTFSHIQARKTIPTFRPQIPIITNFSPANNSISKSEKSWSANFDTKVNKNHSFGEIIKTAIIDASTANGTINVVACSITRTSAAGTDAQTVCNNTAITNRI